jgi:hypothetical protein
MVQEWSQDAIALMLRMAERYPDDAPAMRDRACQDARMSMNAGIRASDRVQIMDVFNAVQYVRDRAVYGR